jgi:hypothetical protein
MTWRATLAEGRRASWRPRDGLAAASLPAKQTTRRDTRFSTGWKPVLLFSRGLHDLGKAAWVEAGAADEGPINVGLAH